MSLRTDLKPALTTVWLILSLCLAMAAAVPFVVPPEVLYGAFPECSARARGSSCPLCGMTTAWVAISRGDLASARQANAGSVPLWTGSVMNFIAAVAYSIKVARRRRR
jgi:hypothetical protein